MKHILLAGKFNAAFEELNNDLAEFFQVQLSSENPELFRNMIGINHPDAVIFTLIGLGPEHTALFNEMRTKYESIPVFCIGNEEEISRFAGFFRTEQFETIERPVKNADLVKHVAEKVGANIDYAGLTEMKSKQEKKTILVVDDNSIQLRAIKDMLPSSNYEVLMATSGSKAIGHLGKKIPDLIFLDYEMPVCDGKQTLEMIREIEEAKHVPVVFLTGVNDTKHIQAVIRLKPAAYLLKPASQDTILDTIHNILGD